MTKWQKSVIERCEKIKEFLGLNEYTLEIDFKEKYQGCGATTEVDYPYLSISITFYDKAKGLDKEGLELLIFHEICHVFSYKLNVGLYVLMSKSKFKPIDEWNEAMVERLGKLLYSFWK